MLVVGNVIVTLLPAALVVTVKSDGTQFVGFKSPFCSKTKSLEGYGHETEMLLLKWVIVKAASGLKGAVNIVTVRAGNVSRKMLEAVMLALPVVSTLAVH